MDGINTHHQEFGKMEERIEALKDAFGKMDDYDFSKSGQRIELLHTDDEFTDLKCGSRGIIELIHKHESEFMPNQIWVRWDNCSTLMLLEGKDQYTEVKE